MVQIVNQEGLGELIGSSLGQALEQLATNKVKRYQESQTAGALANLLNISPQQAMGITKLGPHAQNSFVKELMSKSGNDQFLSALTQSMGGGEDNGIQNYQQPPIAEAPNAIELPNMVAPKQLQPASTGLENNLNNLAKTIKAEPLKQTEAIEPKIKAKKSVEDLATNIAKKVSPVARNEEIKKKLEPTIAQITKSLKQEEKAQPVKATLVKPRKDLAKDLDIDELPKPKLGGLAISKQDATKLANLFVKNQQNSANRKLAAVRIRNAEEKARTTHSLALEKHELAKEKEINKLTTAERKEHIAEQNKSDKETLPFYNKILAGEDVADMADKRLNRMTHLIEKGSLPFAATYKAFKALSDAKVKTEIPLVGGLANFLINGVVNNLGALGSTVQKSVTSRDIEEFEKLSKDFIRDAKNIFGARITDKDLEAYLEMIPTLSQTNNGKSAIIRNMKSFNKASRVQADVMKQLIKENGGKRPKDLPILVKERSKPILDAIAEDFIKGIA